MPAPAAAVEAELGGTRRGTRRTLRGSPPFLMPWASAGEAERARPTVSAATDATIEVLSKASIGHP